MIKKNNNDFLQMEVLNLKYILYMSLFHSMRFALPYQPVYPFMFTVY